jgi:hypothetical protein
MVVSTFKALFLAGLFLMALPALAAQPSTSQITMQTNVLFILDSSASMWGMVNGTSKLDSSRDLLNKTLNDLPVDASLGLVSFGHRRKGDCSDIEIISPMGTDNAATIYKKATALKAKGTSPLASTLMKSQEIFKDVNGAKMIVLITDGGEECGGNPCQAAKDLIAGGLVLRVNVVGFDLPKKEREELECIAREGAGKYFDVTDKKTLFKAITEIKTEINTPVVIEPVATTPAVVVEPPKTPVVQAPQVNLLLPSEGGHIVQQPKAGWERITEGKDRSYIWAIASQEVVYGFKDNKEATFSKFEIEIPVVQKQNVKDFELLISEDSPEGPYSSLGTFTARNYVNETLYQTFRFSKTTAKYFKFRVLSNYGYVTQGWGNTQIFQIRLIAAKK